MWAFSANQDPRKIKMQEKEVATKAQFSCVKITPPPKQTNKQTTSLTFWLLASCNSTASWLVIDRQVSRKHTLSLLAR